MGYTRKVSGRRELRRHWVRIAGTDDRAAIRDALEKVKVEGIFGEYKYTPTDHDGNAGDFYWGVVRKDGQWWPYKK